MFSNQQTYCWTLAILGSVGESVDVLDPRPGTDCRITDLRALRASRCRLATTLNSKHLGLLEVTRCKSMQHERFALAPRIVSRKPNPPAPHRPVPSCYVAISNPQLHLILLTVMTRLLRNARKFDSGYFAGSGRKGLNDWGVKGVLCPDAVDRLAFYRASGQCWNLLVQGFNGNDISQLCPSQLPTAIGLGHTAEGPPGKDHEIRHVSLIQDHPIAIRSLR